MPYDSYDIDYTQLKKVRVAHDDLILPHGKLEYLPRERKHKNQILFL